MSTRLVPNDAVGALVFNGKQQILLQLRDDKPDIFFPNCWGTFGGGVESGETAEQALAREMAEELAMDISCFAVKYFTEFTFDFAPWKQPVVYRKFYTIEVGDKTISDFTLGEGRRMEFFDLAYAIEELKLVPYDGFAIWMYYTREEGI